MIPAHKTAIMVHTLATPPKWAEGKSAEDMVKEVRRWHVEDNGWSDVAYAAIIAPDGTWAKGRDLDKDGNVWEEQAAAARGWNKKAIHIALAGGHGASANDHFGDHFTYAQDVTLRKMIKDLNEKAGRDLKLMGHNEVSAKGCPGFQVRPWFESKHPRSIAGSKTVQGAGAATVGAVGTGATAVGQLDGNAQIVALVLLGVIFVGLAVVFRERIKAWANGRR